MRTCNCFRKYFIEHPESVGENYFTHGITAFSYGIKFICFGFAEVIHAIIPGIDMFELLGTHSFVEIKKIYDDLVERKNK
jgi:hypothetical protein